MIITVTLGGRLERAAKFLTKADDFLEGS